MENQTTPKNAPGRTVIILVDCLKEGEGHTGVFGYGSEGWFLLRLGGLLAGGSGGRLLVCSVVAVPQGESVSSYSVAAQTRRQDLERQALAALSQSPDIGKRKGKGRSNAAITITQQAIDGLHSLVAPVVRVALENDISGEIRKLVENEPEALVLLPLRRMSPTEYPWLRKAFRKPLPCDIAWARPALQNTRNPKSKIMPSNEVKGQNPKSKILVPARGGPQAELSLELAQDLVNALGAGAQVNVLHLVQQLPDDVRAAEEAPFAEFLSSISNKHVRIIPMHNVDMGGHPAETISNAAAGYDLLVMGAGDQPATGVGRFTRQVAKEAQPALIAVKSRIPVGPAIRAARKRARPHALDPETLSLIVDKWFAENTFHAEEFSDLSRLIDIKRKRGLTISVGLPALNEEQTIGEVIKTLKGRLMDDVPLLDELVLIDSNSTDGTREIAAELGIPVYIHQEVLPEAGPPVAGKGEALWKSLHVLKGDIIAWVDTDVANMHPQFVYGLIGPLLREPRIGYVKGYYHRPIKTGDDLQHEGGGRVTELTVRPLLNLFYPLLSGLVQPLAGEYAGRREVLEQLPFFSGYGVETGLLIDLLEHYGLSTIGQVNLEKRIHRNRSLSDLSLTAFAIVQVILMRLQERASVGARGLNAKRNPPLLEEVNRSMKLIRFEKDHLSLVVRHVQDVERPPIATIPAYREAHPPK